MANLEWRNEKRKLNELIPCESNPRKMTSAQRLELMDSLKKFSLAEVPIITIDNKIIAGHQRISALTELYGGEQEIDVRVANRALSEQEYKEYLIRSNKNVGEWDWEKLNSDFNTDDLVIWGFDARDFESLASLPKPKEDINLEEKVFYIEINDEDNYLKAIELLKSNGIIIYDKGLRDNT